MDVDFSATPHVFAKILHNVKRQKAKTGVNILFERLCLTALVTL